MEQNKPYIIRLVLLYLAEMYGMLEPLAFIAIKMHSTNGTLVPLVPGRVNLNKEKSHVYRDNSGRNADEDTQ